MQATVSVNVYSIALDMIMDGIHSQDFDSTNYYEKLQDHPFVFIIIEPDIYSHNEVFPSY